MTSRMNLWITLAAIAVAGSAVPEAHAGLIALYHFDESNGATAADSVGSVNGTLAGSAAFVSGGISGNAVSLSKVTQLDPIGGLVNMGDNFNFSSNFSIQAWVKLTESDQSYQVPVARHYSGVNRGYFLGINDTGDGCSAINAAHFYAGYPCSGNSPTVVNDGAWHQLVGVFDSGTASIYVDGALQSSSNGSSALFPTVDSGVTFLVGGVTVGGAPTPTFTGLIDEVGVWNSSLTAEDVQGLYTGVTNPTPEPASVAMMLGGVLAMAGFGLRRKARQQ